MLLRANRSLLKIVPKFEPKQEAWLEDELGDRPGCEVIIENYRQNTAGSWEYTLKYKNTRLVSGGAWFPETQLRREKPWY